MSRNHSRWQLDKDATNASSGSTADASDIGKGTTCGDDDPATPPDRNKLIASKIPGARYEDIAKARHLPNVERPEPFNRLMMSFLGLNR